MNIEIPDEQIKQMVQEQTEDSVKKRIKQMQGAYTSKAYLEEIISHIVWDKILELCPDIENYIQEQVDKSIDFAFQNQDKMSKKQLVECVINGLLEHLKQED